MSFINENEYVTKDLSPLPENHLLSCANPTNYWNPQSFLLKRQSQVQEEQWNLS